MRVMSRKPPAASRSIVGRSSSFALATSMSVEAASCGTWLTSATSSSWWSGVSVTTSAPRSRTTRSTCVYARSSVRAVGVSVHVEPTNNVGVGAVNALLLRTGHGMTAHEPRRCVGALMFHLGHHRALHRPDVRHHRRARVERGHHGLRDRAHRNRDHHQVGADDGIDERGRDLADGSQTASPGRDGGHRGRSRRHRTRVRPARDRPNLRSAPFRRSQPGRPPSDGKVVAQRPRAFEVHVVELARGWSP